MTTHKRSLYKDTNLIKTSRTKLIIGVLIGLFFSFAFYSFLYLLREAFRILSVTEIYDLWILSDKEVQFYNLFFAFISVIIGQSMALTFIFDRPKRISETRDYINTTIVNDQRALNWYFLSWFSKLAFVFGGIFGLNSLGTFYVFSFFPDYKYVFILIVIVLFFQTWNTIGLTYKKGQKWMLTSAVLVSMVAFGISKINLIDYNAMNQNYLKKNIFHSYHLELPESDNYQELNSRLIENIYIAEPKTNQTDSKPLIFVGNEEVPIEELQVKIVERQSTIEEYKIPFLTYRLNIHENIKLDLVDEVKYELAKLGVSRIAYAVIPSNPAYDKRYYQGASYTMFLPNRFSDAWQTDQVYKDLEESKHIIEVKKSESNYLINNLEVATNQFKNTLKEHMQQNANYVIKLFVNKDLSYLDYQLLSSYIRTAINELRSEYAERKFSKPLDMLSDSEALEVKQKFPLRIFESLIE